MYIKYIDNKTDYKLNDGDSVLMSLEQFKRDGKNLKGIPITYTKDGSEPKKEVEDELLGICE